GPAEGCETKPEREPAVAVPPHEIVMFQGDCEPVRSGSRHPGRGHELGQGLRSRHEAVDDVDRLVEHADAAYTPFHVTRLPSHYVGAQSCRKHSVKRSGTATSCDHKRASRICCTSIFISCTRSR